MTHRPDITDALLPCPVPWCGGEARLDTALPDMRERFIICEKCGLRSPNSKPFDTAGVTALWNTRAMQASQPAQVLPPKASEPFKLELTDELEASQPADDVVERLRRFVELRRRIVSPSADGEIQLIADLENAIAALSQQPNREVEAMRAEILRLVDALHYAHSEGLEWPVDPLPFGSIAHDLFIERGNERISE